MSGFKQTMGRAGARCGLLAMLVVSAVALSGLFAGSAMAAPGCPGKAKTIKGQGSSLQRIAQTEVWIPDYGMSCPLGPKVEYTSTSSGTGLQQWNFNAMGAFNREFQFIGTDDAPTGPQIATARESANPLNEPNVLTIPVTQTAIAIVANVPNGCELEEDHITNHDLSTVFGGTITTWGQISTASGECAKTLTRVVRKDGSGTTFQFKNYLQEIAADGGPGLPCVTEGHNTWQELEPIEAGSKPNITWPECGGGAGADAEMAVERPANTGGGAVVATVAAMEGTIGYAALPDAKAPGNGLPTVLSVENGEEEGAPTFASPEGPNETANCTETEYTVPVAARVGGGGTNVDWSGVFGGHPTIGGGKYPICTLTYDLAWDDYELAGFAGGIWENVRDYLTEEVLAAGQAAIASNWYAPLPAPALAANNVLAAARYAAEMIEN